MKLLDSLSDDIKRMSHSARSAWIETLLNAGAPRGSTGRTPQGVRGLKPHGTFMQFQKIPVALRKECVD